MALAMDYVIDEHYDDAPSFKMAIAKFIKTSESIGYTNEPRDIITASNEFGFRQRRFFDVLKVMEILGCCQNDFKHNKYIWLGYRNIKGAIYNLCKTYGAFDQSKSLDSIIVGTGAISIPRVAKELLVLCGALELKKVNLLEASKYLSRNNNHEKTTRCKLYQAIGILEVAGIFEKNEVMSEYNVSKDFFTSTTLQLMDSKDRTSLGNLLNSAPSFIINSTLEKRRKEYFAVINQGEVMLDEK